MIAIEWSANPYVFETSGVRFSVQLMQIVRRSLKSHGDCHRAAQHPRAT
jgi:hypothetical protein